MRRYLQFFVSKHCTSMACMSVIYPRETDLKLILTLSLHISLLLAFLTLQKEKKLRYYLGKILIS